MKRVIMNYYLKTAKLLLCLPVFYCSSCNSLRRFNHEVLETSKPLLQVAVTERDLAFFMQMTKELDLVPVNFHQRMPDTQNNETKEFCITFRFANKNEFLLRRSEIMSTGLVSKIIH